MLHSSNTVSLGILSEKGLEVYNERLNGLKNISIEKQHMFEELNVAKFVLATIEDHDIYCATRDLDITDLWDICKEFDNHEETILDIRTVSEIIMDIIENMVQQ